MASSGDRLRSAMGYSRSAHPGSDVHSASGACRPAITATASPGSLGSSFSRSHPSSPWQRSKVSMSRTVPSPVHAASASLSNASGVGWTVRPSISSTGRPAIRASAAKRRSSIDLPMPPGPCTKITAGAPSSPARAARNTASSAVRPRNIRSRPRCSRLAMPLGTLLVMWEPFRHRRFPRGDLPAGHRLILTHWPMYRIRTVRGCRRAARTRRCGWHWSC
ncbi:hypothetical protein SFUMM280S_02491 [Streptomyces fumanus]